MTLHRMQCHGQSLQGRNNRNHRRKRRDHDLRIVRSVEVRDNITLRYRNEAEKERRPPARPPCATPPFTTTGKGQRDSNPATSKPWKLNTGTPGPRGQQQRREEGKRGAKREAYEARERHAKETQSKAATPSGAPNPIPKSHKLTVRVIPRSPRNT